MVEKDIIAEVKDTSPMFEVVKSAEVEKTLLMVEVARIAEVEEGLAYVWGRKERRG
jgi:hypothetical protein